MGKDTYIILRVGGATRGESPGPLDGGEVLGVAPDTEYAVEAQELDDRGVAEHRRDPEVAGLAQPMPLRLIAPLAAGPGAAPEPVADATWGVFVTGAPQSPYSGRGVTVAVLDTGIDAAHEAFAGVELVQRDFTGEGDGDQNGHGTHVAGTIFGRPAGGLRYSVAPGVSRALIGKVLGQGRPANTADLVAAVQWAAGSGAQVINMSLGFDFPGQVRRWVEEFGYEPDLATSRALAQYRDNLRLFDTLVRLLQAQGAAAQGALIVAAAGNESRRSARSDYTIEVSPPAAADGVVSVAALQSAGPPHTALGVASFSNIRAAVAGPGVDIYSARAGGGYRLLSGTSMASPHVAGVAALWAERQLQRSGRVSVETLSAQLRGNASLARLQGARPLDVGDGLVAAPAS